MTKKTLSLFLSLALLAGLCACSPGGGVDVPPTPPASSSAPSTAPDGPVPEYSFIGRTKYYRNGKECAGYRVAVGDEATEADMRAVFSDLCSGDSYYLHTVWFYGLPSDADTIGFYTVGLLEETAPGAAPEFTPCSFDIEEIEELREKAAEEAGRLDAARSIPSPSIQQEALVPDNLFSPVDGAIFTTTAAENGLADSAFFVEGVVASRSEVGGYDTIQVTAEAGEVYISGVSVPLPEEIAEGDSVTVFFVYQGFSEALGAPAGVYVYHE